MTDSLRDINELMSGYIDGQLSPEEKAAAETALQSDATAARVLAELQTLRSGIKALGTESAGIPSVADQVLAGLDKTSDATSDATSDEVPASPVPTVTPKLPATRTRKLVFYFSVAAVLLAAAGIWQVLQPVQDQQGTPIVDVIEDNNSIDYQDNNIGPSDVPESNTDQSQLVDNGDGNNPQSPGDDVDSNTPNTPEVPQPEELVNVPEVPEKGSLVGTQPDLSLLTNGKFLFVIEVGVTPEGVKADAIREVLMKNGIVYDGGLEVMPDLEQQLLKSRYLDGVVQKDEQPVGGTVDLIYMVASGLQIDQTRLDIHARHEHIARYRFNMALLPKDVNVFENLHRTVKSQWVSEEQQPNIDDKAAYQQQLKDWQGKASRLMTTLYFLAGKGAAVSKVGIEIPPTPKVPKGANRGDLKKPSPTEKPILGADLICEVLLVVRNMTQAEVEQLPDPQRKAIP